MPNFPVIPLRTHTLRDDVHEIFSGSSVKSCCILLKVLRGTEPILDLQDHIFTGCEPKKFNNHIFLKNKLIFVAKIKL